MNVDIWVKLMGRLNPLTPSGTPPAPVERERRKAYYPGKYARQMTTLFVIVIAMAALVLTF